MPTPKGKFEFRAKDKTKGTFASLGKSLKAVTGSIVNMKSALALAAGGAGFGLLIASSLKSIDLLGKTADKIGITTEGLSKMQLAASLAGVESNTLNKSLQKMIVNIADTASGTGEASDAFKLLGLDAKELIELNPEDQFAEISEAMNKLENNTQRVSAAYDIFGGRGTALLNLTKQGKAGLAAIGEEAEALGLTMSRDAVAGVEAANDSLTRLFSIGKGFSNQLTAALAPAIEEVVIALKDFVLESAKGAGGIKGFAQSFGITLLQGFKAGIDGIQTFLDFVDAAKDKLIEWGIIDGETSAQRATGLQDYISVLDNTINNLDFLNVRNQTWIDMTAERKVVQDELNKLLGLEPTILDRASAALDGIIGKARERLALAKAGIKDETPKGKKPSGDSTAKALGLTQEEIDSRMQALKDFLAQKSEAIAASLLTDDEQLLSSHERRSLMVEEAALRDVITSERKNEIIKKLDEKLAADQKKIQDTKDKTEKGMQISRLKFAAGVARSLVSLVGSSSKKCFEIGKKVAKAGVIMDTAAGIMKVIGQGGFAGMVAAVGVAIAGAAQLANINRTQFGGGGGISSGGVSFPSPTAGNPPASVAPNDSLQTNIPTSSLNITILGNVVGNEEFVTDTLVPILQDAINNNDTVLINGDSAQALELAS